MPWDGRAGGVVLKVVVKCVFHGDVVIEGPLWDWSKEFYGAVWWKGRFGGVGPGRGDVEVERIETTRGDESEEFAVGRVELERMVL